MDDDEIMGIINSVTDYDKFILYLLLSASQTHAPCRGSGDSASSYKAW